MEVERGAESWQFFAFIFAALLTLFFGLIDELPNAGCWHFILKILAFVVTGYFTLLNARCRNCLVGILHRIKKERHS